MWPCIVDHGTPTSINHFPHIYYTYSQRTHGRCKAVTQWSNCTFWLQCAWHFKQTFSELLDWLLLLTNITHAITVAARQPWAFHIGQCSVGHYQGISGWRCYCNSDKLHRAVKQAVTMRQIFQCMPYRIWRHMKLCWEHDGAHTDPLDVWCGSHHLVKLSRRMVTPQPLCIGWKFPY
jgi:hypothetical protein